MPACSAERYFPLKNPLASEKYEITPSPCFTQTRFQLVFKSRAVVKVVFRLQCFITRQVVLAAHFQRRLKDVLP